MKVSQIASKGPLSSDRQFWTARQVMAELNIGKTKAYALIADGELGNPIRVGGLRIRRDGLIAFIERKEAEMAAELDSRFA